MKEKKQILKESDVKVLNTNEVRRAFDEAAGFDVLREKKRIEAFIRKAYNKEKPIVDGGVLALKEICGILFENLKIVQIPNCSETSGVEYVMEPKKQIEAILKHGKWRCIWHTHPHWKAIPSAVDLQYSFVGTYYLIYSGIDDNFRLWLRKETGFEEIKW